LSIISVSAVTEARPTTTMKIPSFGWLTLTAPAILIILSTMVVPVVVMVVLSFLDDSGSLTLRIPMKPDKNSDL